MKKYSGFARWGPAAGVLAVGMLAFSLSLEGAGPSPQPPVLRERVDTPAPVDEQGSDAARDVVPEVQTNVPTRSGHVTSTMAPSTELPEGISAGRLPKGDLPVFPSMTVDYRDDAGTRMREAGQLVGRYRPDAPEGAVAGPGCTPPVNCSFDLQCDDKKPCTNDVCNIAVGAPLGSGTCINAELAVGADGGCSDGLCCNGRETCTGPNGSRVCEAPGLGTGVFSPGVCGFPCLGGTVCNEDTNLCRAACTGANTCSITLGPCNSTSDCIPPAVANAPAGNYCLNCNDGVLCNGTETCVAGVCEAGTNPCGPGAICGEKDCSGAGTTVCTTDSDCSVAQLGTCTRPGPICFPGRCCDVTLADPSTSCTKRQKSGGLCSGGSNNGANCQSVTQCQVCTSPPALLGKPCTVPGDCPLGVCGAAGTCNTSNATTGSCDTVVPTGKWYATDDGDLPVPGGNVCPIPDQENPANDRTLCPHYSSGVAPQMDFDTEIGFLVGPISAYGPCDHREIGDDYEIVTASPAIAMEHFRWIGGGGGRLLIEFYDDATPPNFIEDVVTGGISGEVGVRSLNFLPVLTLPRKGFVVISVAANFAPNGQTFAAFTDGFEEGTNVAIGARSWWFNTGPNDTRLQECVNALPNDRFDGAWCDPDLTHPANAECGAQGGTCTDRDNIMAFEIEGIAGALPTGACCNNGTGACTAGVLPWVCVAQGNNYLGNSTLCPGTCGNGACCTAGVCTITAGAGLCGGAFQGFGTTCDANNDASDGLQNCCPQTPFGANDCNNVTVHNLTVPEPGLPPLVRTITGNNTPATVETGPTACNQGAWNSAGGTYLTVDAGWWEAFRINTCANVRIDFCCSEPIVEPAWALIWDGCPCDDPIFTEVDPGKPLEPGNKRGTPYCGDDNLWNKYITLPGGTCSGGANDGKACSTDAGCPGIGTTCVSGHTYYVPVYSVPPGAHAQYQMHITVEGCPRAACCNGGSCAFHPITGNDLNELECQDINGAVFLSPPFRNTAVSNCIPGTTCATGSCCYIPGQPLCTDIISAQLATETLCESGPNPGVYKGGARCKGCVCSAGAPPPSCTVDTDCGLNACNDPEGGACVIGSNNQTQPSPCPVCDFETIGHCQRQPGYDGGRLSDECTGNCVSDPALTEFSLPGIRAADDFMASVSGSIGSVCVWGVFVRNGDPNAGDNCDASGPPEKFKVKIYNDVNGLPSGAAIGGTHTTTVLRKDLTSTSGGRRVFQWQLTIDGAPIPVLAGQTYWLEVTNNTDESSGLANCDWFWALSDPDQGADSGNQYTLQDVGTVYTFGDATFDGADLAWCLPIDSTVPLIQEAACCTCAGGAGSCSVQTLENCTNADGSWRPTEPDCVGVEDCRDVADGPDNCAAAIAPGGGGTVATNSATAWNNYCANTDGPATGGGADCSAGLDAQADLWYSWIATDNCNVLFETCDTGGEIDTMIVAYSNGTGTCVCPTSATTEVGCDDDGCVFGGAGSRLTLPVIQGRCYLIRVAGFQGTKGEGVLHVGECVSTVEPEAAPASVKTKFITIDIQTNSDCISLNNPYLCCTGPGTGNCSPEGQTAAADDVRALRVKLTELHHVGRCDGGTNDNGPCTTNAQCPGPASAGGGVCSAPLNTNCTSDAQCTGTCNAYCIVPYPAPALSTPFTFFEGQAVYVGRPQQYCEAGSTTSGCVNPFFAALTQCAPNYQDWSTVSGPLHIYGSAIVPSSTYHVEWLAESCEGIESGKACVSGGSRVGPQLQIKTTRWGDVQIPYNPPSTTTQPDLGDIAGLVGKFATPSSQNPSKARGLIFGGDAFGTITSINVNLGFTDIAGCVDAFRGIPYPFKMGKCTGPATLPFTGSCTTSADCTGAGLNGAGPCTLLKVGHCTGPRAAGFSGNCLTDANCTAGTNGAPPCDLSCAP